MYHNRRHTLSILLKSKQDSLYRKRLLRPRICLQRLIFAQACLQVASYARSLNVKKICTVCGAEFVPTLNQTRKGWWNCLECQRMKDRAYMKRRKAAGFHRIRRYNAEWMRKYNQKPERKAQQARLRRKYWRMPHKRFKEQARRKLQLAVQHGKIIRGPCSQCGAPKSEGHHEDYSKPFEVQWLCRPCHRALHRSSPSGALRSE